MADNLYKGIAVIIDDEIRNFDDFAEPINKEEQKKKDKDDIFAIIDKIKEKKIPFLTFNNRPPDETIENFNSISFVLLDWKLYSEDQNPTLDRINTESNVDFISKIIKKCFVPIFIFSNEDPEEIKEKLGDKNLYSDEDERNFIFIQKKSELVDHNGLFKQIEAWINNHPTAYLIKKWDSSFNDSKNDSFWHLFNRSPIWSKILTNSFIIDKINVEENLNDVLFRIIKAKTKLKDINIKTLSESKGDFNYKEVSEVIYGTTFIDKEYLEKNDIKVGDVFKKDKKYYLNIRPDCDSVIERESFDGELYLIKGSELSSGQKKQLLEQFYDEALGFREIHNEALVIGLNDKDIVCFKFNKIYKEDANEYINKRICRLLPPYSAYVQQRFNAYMGRIGIPRYPAEIIKKMKGEDE